MSIENPQAIDSASHIQVLLHSSNYITDEDCQIGDSTLGYSVGMSMPILVKGISAASIDCYLGFSMAMIG